MLSSRNNAKSSAVAFIALLTLSAVVAVLPAFAQKTYIKMPDRDTGTFVGASPKLVGLGQKVLINILTYPAPSGPTLYAQDLVSKAAGGLSNISVTITKPDGTKDAFIPIDETLAQIGIEIPGQAQNVGSLQFQYEPNQVGGYSVTASFPGKTYTTDETFANLNLSVYYKPSSSGNAATFSVQEDTVLAGLLNGYPWSPLPTAYWTTPVQTDNREWASISGAMQGGSFFGGTNYNPYSTAPKTAHVLWANQVEEGGIVGGDWGSLGYDGSSFFGKSAGQAPIVMNGRIYQNDPLYTGTFSCIDLQMGKTLWTKPGSISNLWRLAPSVFQTAAQQNEGGISSYLVGSSPGAIDLYDSFTGALVQSITGVPPDVALGGFAGVPVSDGNPIVFIAQSGGWNTTLPGKWAYEYLIKWNYSKVNPYGGTFDQGIEWNVSIRRPNGVGVNDGRVGMITVAPWYGANVVTVKGHNDENFFMGFDMTTGAYLYTANTVIDLVSFTGNPDGPYLVFDGATASWFAYNVKTGQEMWHTQVGKLPWAALPVFEHVVNNGNFYIGCFDGHVYALDLADGHIVWTSDSSGASDESIYGNPPFNGYAQGAGADGKLYFASTNTYALEPRTRFQVLVCIDEATGHFLWKLPIGAEPKNVAYGCLVAIDEDNSIQYCFGKGKTATTVSIQNDVISKGSGALIQGTVMDLSPGQPNTAAVSDADMSEWMDYLHGQNATLINSPPVPTGVPVQLTAVGSDGAAVDLGTVTSDESGHFAKAWTPSAQGLYKIYATFAGSDSYWSSYAETSLSVGPAPETSQQPPTTQTADNTPLIAATVAIIIAIAIVGALTLRKGKR